MKTKKSLLIVLLTFVFMLACLSTQIPEVATQTLEPTLQPTATELPSELTDAYGVPMVLVPAGEFAMGSESDDIEKPVHQVYLDAFYMDKYEVTNAHYKVCVDSENCHL